MLIMKLQEYTTRIITLQYCLYHQRYILSNRNGVQGGNARGYLYWIHWWHTNSNNKQQSVKKDHNKVSQAEVNLKTGFCRKCTGETPHYTHINEDLEQLSSYGKFVEYEYPLLLPPPRPVCIPRMHTWKINALPLTFEHHCDVFTGMRPWSVPIQLVSSHAVCADPRCSFTHQFSPIWQWISQKPPSTWKDITEHHLADVTGHHKSLVPACWVHSRSATATWKIPSPPPTACFYCPWWLLNICIQLHLWLSACYTPGYYQLTGCAHLFLSVSWSETKWKVRMSGSGGTSMKPSFLFCGWPSCTL